MKWLGAAGAVVAMLAGGAPAAAAPDGELRFSVFLDEREIGVHRFRFERASRGYMVDSRAELRVRFLFVTAYRYRHHSRERWDEGCLARIVARTNDGGTRFFVRGQRRDGHFIVERDSERRTLPACVQTFAYWDPDLLQAGRLLNAQTGEYLDVELQDLGGETVTMPGGDVQAERRRIVGEGLRIDLWHTPQGRWIALESKTSGGVLRYRLQTREMSP